MELNFQTWFPGCGGEERWRWDSRWDRYTCQIELSTLICRYI